MSLYAIVRTGGKQYRVSEGDTLQVEKIPANPGEEIQLDTVLFLRHEGKSITGSPLVSGASVKAEVVRQLRSPKVIVFKQHQKKVFRKTHGHRQSLTELRIKQISIPNA